MKAMKVQRLPYLTIALFAVVTAGPAQAEIINVGTAFRGGGLADGFPEFLSQANGTTQAWNLGGNAGDTLYNGVSVVDVPNVNITVGDLTTAGGSLDGPTSTPNFSGNPDGQDAARNAIFHPGFQGFLGGVGIVNVMYNIAATQGQLYEVELLGDAHNGNRTGDVTVDGTLFADDLYSPASGGGVTLVYRFQVTADADGIDILIEPGSGVSPGGGAASTAAIFSAISVTAVPEPRSFAMLALMGGAGLVLRPRSRKCSINTD